MQLFNGNCLDILPTLTTKVDAIICDLLYGTTNCPWNIVIPFDDMWKCLNKITNTTTPIILFGQEPFSSCLRCSNF